MESLLRAIIKLFAKVYFHLVYAPRQANALRRNVPVSGKLLTADDLQALIDASLDMWLTTGRFNDQFEKEFAATAGLRHCLTVNSGSSANLLAVSTLTSPRLGGRRLRRGDEAITVASGFPTTVTPILQNGLIPVFVDCEKGTGNIDAALIERAITKKTRLVIAAHTLGTPFAADAVREICDRHGLWFIEDCCDALGATLDSRRVGTMGHIATFSFYPAHHITMGEGGAVATDDNELHRLLMSFRDWGRDCWCPPGHDGTCKNRFGRQFGNLPFGYDHKYTYSNLGFNLKITDWQAAIGLTQLKKLPDFLSRRKANGELLRSLLGEFADLFILPEPVAAVAPSWFGFLLSVKPAAGFSKQELVEFLEGRGIVTRQLFAGNILRQPMFTENDFALRLLDSEPLLSCNLTEEHYTMLPNTEGMMNDSFWLGTYPGLGAPQMETIAGAIRAFVREKGR